MRNKKDLYLASCMDELITKTTLPIKMKNLDLPTLSRRAFNVYNEAMKWNNENDEEHVYIFLMKYCQILQMMRNFKTDEKYTSLMHADNLKKALKMLTHVKESLENRYKERNKQDNNKLLEYPMQNGTLSIEKKLYFDCETTITNENLFFLLEHTDRKKICLLDTRPSEVFHKFKIISCDVINIPKENLISGLTAAIILDKLEEPYKEKWMKRHLYDYIVILDQGTEDIEGDPRLINLKNALLKWDPNQNNSKKVKFLKGGYEDFNHFCPWETTQHDTKKLTESHEPDIELEEPKYEEYISNLFLQI